MLGKTEPYKIAESPKYNVSGAKENLYANSPTTNYGIRNRFKTEYQKINF